MNTSTAPNNDGSGKIARLSPALELTITVKRGCVVLSSSGVDVEPEASDFCDMLLLPLLSIKRRATVEYRQSTCIQCHCRLYQRSRVVEPIMTAIRESEKAAPAGRGVNKIEELRCPITSLV